MYLTAGGGVAIFQTHTIFLELSTSGSRFSLGSTMVLLISYPDYEHTHIQSLQASAVLIGSEALWTAMPATKYTVDGWGFWKYERAPGYRVRLSELRK